MVCSNAVITRCTHDLTVYETGDLQLPAIYLSRDLSVFILHVNSDSQQSLVLADRKQVRSLADRFGIEDLRRVSGWSGEGWDIV